MTSEYSQESVDVRDAVELHVVSSGSHTLGWIHTHGMDKLGLADLEIRGVPLFLMESAAHLLNDVAQHMLNLARVGVDTIQLGQVITTSPYSTFKLVKLPPIAGAEDHFTLKRWALSDEPMHKKCGKCDDCRCGGEALN